MFRQVLVPVKFSVCGRLAAWHACDVVRAIGGTVTLLHVLEHAAPGHAELEAGEAQDAEARCQEARHREALALLRQLSLYARCPPNLLIVPALNGSARYGSELHSLEPYSSAPGGVASAILKVAAETGAQLIMLGLRSHSGPVQRMLGQGVLGRVVEPVLLGAGVPVQVTPCHPDTGVATGARSAGWRGVLAKRN